MKSLTLTVLALIAIALFAPVRGQDAGRAPAVQQPAVAELKPNDLQRAHLETKQVLVYAARLKREAAQREFEWAMAEFYTECDRVKAENKWDAGVQCNINTLSITPALAPPSVPAPPGLSPKQPAPPPATVPKP